MKRLKNSNKISCVYVNPHNKNLTNDDDTQDDQANQ